MANRRKNKKKQKTAAAETEVLNPVEPAKDPTQIKSAGLKPTPPLPLTKPRSTEKFSTCKFASNDLVFRNFQSRRQHVIPNVARSRCKICNRERFKINEGLFY